MTGPTAQPAGSVPDGTSVLLRPSQVRRGREYRRFGGGAVLVAGVLALAVACSGGSGGSKHHHRHHADASTDATRSPSPSASDSGSGSGSASDSAPPAAEATVPPLPTLGAGSPIDSPSVLTTIGHAGAGGAPSDQCPAATVTVHDADELTAALAAARAGTVISLTDGRYDGSFTGQATGTAAHPVVLCGGPDAVLDGGGVKKGYVFHLQDSAYWKLMGFTVQDGQKGVVLDHTQHSTVVGLTVRQIGDEGIHLREFSSDDLVAGNTIGDTGLRRDKFGEGVYLGSAKSNWCTYTDCRPDRSDADVVLGNVFGATTAENVDIKEGTTGGKVLDNTFNGSGLTSAGGSAWVNAKGNGYLIAGNTGRTSPKDGFQTHQILPGWGTDNVFEDNTAVVNGPGYGFHLTPVLNNRVACDNKQQGATLGLSNVPCSDS